MAGYTKKIILQLLLLIYYYFVGEAIRFLKIATNIINWCKYIGALDVAFKADYILHSVVCLPSFKI